MSEQDADAEIRHILDQIIEICNDSKAVGLTAYNLQGQSILYDYVVVCSANSTTHLGAIESNLSLKLKDDHQLLPRSTEGQPESGWVILDYADIVVHVFSHEVRDDYAFDDIFAECERTYEATEEESIS